ncbi:50S ribosomal protein L29 [Lujinxingia vulgaris]|uniref:Large ribosomal subunit protein uL29 n=2 Tax=Lujinxingia TaxID=2653226 RepID=A0A5C6X484_9DELT|nr:MULTISPECIES: 50S ribosomal protein L29 [Lujinxingia]RDV38073.1 50S ribosomal protein L29 [Bradymonadaceae bacterium TMQ3]TXC75743.1 50S ribosomal protein L29 [Bradymonadales bacterium TMQ1]RVU42258.1 50S ribosomal protein L29 [Lujinxingia sediminis]TXD35093.1 50S ribosomal protein L29 [Lujinxingia vulgaris]TXD35406.1 50S ribosomal protein L29 [Lujinxingia vulgaris]
MKSAELREKNEQELRELAGQLRDDLFRMRLKHYTGQLQQTSQLRQTRRDIARVETLLRERQG